MDKSVSGYNNLLGRKYYTGNSVKKKMPTIFTGSFVTLIPFLILVVGYELFPLLQLAIKSFRNKVGAFSLENYLNIFTTPLYQMAIVNSLRISMISALVGIAAATIAAASYYECGEKFKKCFMMILNMTSNFSGVPLTFAFMILMGNTGVLTLIGKELSIPLLGEFNLYSGSGLLLIYIYFQIPLSTLLLMPAFLGIRKEWKEAALILRANSFHYWTRVALPNLLPGILGTLSVLFANALAAYASAYALILNNYAMLPLQISGKFKGDVRIDKEMGGALAMILIALMVFATLLSNYIVKRHAKGRELV